MKQPQTKTYDELTNFAKEIETLAKTIARLELLIELQELCETKAQKTKSAYERKAWTTLKTELEQIH